MASELHIALIAFQPDVGDGFIQTLCGSTNREYTTDSTKLQFSTHLQDSTQPALAGLDLRLVNGVILLVRFLDNMSLEQVKTVHSALPSYSVLPLVVVIYREAGEGEFKISCSACGQKLWVRDSDAGRSGRCPHCRKVFILPTQIGILRSYLMLTEATPIVQVTKAKAATARATIAGLMDRVKATHEAMKSQTMRVQIPADETSKG